MVSKADTGVPVGPGSDIDYTITVRNIGNAAATGVTVSDPLPANTTFVSAGQGGQVQSGKVVWTGLTVPAGGSVALTFTVSISASLPSSVDAIVNDGIAVTASGGVGTTGQPAHDPDRARARGDASTRRRRPGAPRSGTSATYTVHVTNEGYQPDSYA